MNSGTVSTNFQKNIVFKEHSSLDKMLGSFKSDTCIKQKNILCKSKESLSWRYKNPTKKYKFFSLTKNYHIVALLVIEVRKHIFGKSFFVVDYFFNDPHFGEALFANLATFCRMNRIVKVEFFIAVSEQNTIAMIKRLDFVERLGKYSVLGYFQSQGDDLRSSLYNGENWFITIGDKEI